MGSKHSNGRVARDTSIELDGISNDRLLEGLSNNEVRALAAGMFRMVCALQQRHHDIVAACESGDPNPIRGGMIDSLQVIGDAVEPYLSETDRLAVVSVLSEQLASLIDGHRGWLTRLPSDQPHVWLGAPSRRYVQAVAAATLQYYGCIDHGQTQEAVAAKIAKSLALGGFRVRNDKEPTKKAVINWRHEFRPSGADSKGTKRKPRTELDRETFTSYVEHLRNSAITMDDAISELSKLCKRSLFEPQPMPLA
jgi:hypothetical protein